jgi:hypothetical protein
LIYIANTQLVEILDWNTDDTLASGGTYSSLGTTIAFPGGITTAPRDGVSVLYGDRLEPNYDASLLILCFVVGLIACWCATILGKMSRRLCVGVYEQLGTDLIMIV